MDKQTDEALHRRCTDHGCLINRAVLVQVSCVKGGTHSGFSGRRVVSYGEGRSTLDFPLIHDA